MMSPRLFFSLLLLIILTTAYAPPVTGRAVTIPARQIAALGELPVLPLIVEHPLTLDPNSDPAAVDWTAIGLLVTSDLIATAYPAWMEAADAAGVPVFVMTAITSLDTWREMAFQLGEATGQETRAKHLIQRLDRRIAVVRMRARQGGAVRVLVITPEAYTFGQGAMITELIELAGGINVAAEAGFQDYRQIDDQMIRDLAPDVVLLTPSWKAVADFAVRSPHVFRLPFNPTLPDDPGAALLWLSLALLTH